MFVINTSLNKDYLQENNLLNRCCETVKSAFKFNYLFNSRIYSILNSDLYNDYKRSIFGAESNYIKNKPKLKAILYYYNYFLLNSYNYCETYAFSSCVIDFLKCQNMDSNCFPIITENCGAVSNNIFDCGCIEVVPELLLPIIEVLETAPISLSFEIPILYKCCNNKNVKVLYISKESDGITLGNTNEVFTSSPFTIELNIDYNRLEVGENVVDVKIEICGQILTQTITIIKP